MRKYWIRWISVFFVLVMLQGRAYTGRAFGEAQVPEDIHDPGAAAVERTEPHESPAAPEPTDGRTRQSSYVFQPKVCSAYMEEVFGKAMCETWFHLVDAVMAGEDTFACPDQYTYDWVMGQFPIFTSRSIIPRSFQIDNCWTTVYVGKAISKHSNLTEEHP